MVTVLGITQRMSLSTGGGTGRGFGFLGGLFLGDLRVLEAGRVTISVPRLTITGLVTLLVTKVTAGRLAIERPTDRVVKSFLVPADHVLGTTVTATSPAIASTTSTSTVVAVASRVVRVVVLAGSIVSTVSHRTLSAWGKLSVTPTS